MLSLHVYEIMLFCRTVNSHFPMVEIPFPDISSPKTQKPELRKSRFLKRFCSSSCVLQSAPYDVKLIRSSGGAKRVGSRAIKMLRDLRRRAQFRAACRGGECARQSKSTYVNWSRWCQGSSRTIGCAMARSKMRDCKDAKRVTSASRRASPELRLGA